jgi:adenylate cyclase class IV
MARSIEVEIKYEILDMAGVDRFVAKLRPAKKKHIRDVYLDTPGGALFTRGIFIRLRNDASFDIKFNPDDLEKSAGDEIEHTHCDEVSTPLPIRTESLERINETLGVLGLVPMTTVSLDDFMADNGLLRSLVIDKHRTSYESGEYRIDIDEVADLGHFLEIEKMTDEHADRSAILEGMRQAVHDLSLKVVDVGYNELYWRKHNFSLYESGKYKLSEDRA